MPRPPLRVLHALGGLNRGGVETWLLNLLRRADRSMLAMDFVVHREENCAYDAEALSLGARVLRCPRDRIPRYLRSLWRAIHPPAPYDVVHSHLHAYSGWVLSLAALAGVPVRIVHSHLDSREQERRPSTWRRAYLGAMDRLIRRNATAGFAASLEAGKALYGNSWGVDPRWSILRCAIDTTPFEAPARPALRAELGIRSDAFVIGHVGRFAEQKNHAFLVAIAEEIAALEPAAHLLLVGDGPLRKDIERRVVQTRLGDRVTFAGQRSDVAALMVGVMDAFVLPSLFEGLPLVAVEAQAAGLPCLVSDTVSPESSVVDGLFSQESLQAPPRTWATRLLRFPRKRSEAERRRALSAVKASPFEIGANLKLLHDTYLRLRWPVTSLHGGGP
jgi:glycosyltransferase involved in cell wall biosynthesis